MKPKKQIFGNLFKLAQSVEPIKGARIVAAITLRGRVVSYGFNHLKTNPFQSQYAKNRHAVYFHAETHAIKNALRIIEVDELAKCELYIMRARYNQLHNWEYGISFPCEGCTKCIDDFGIKQVYYSLDSKGFKSLY